jgi:uncharacterized Zn finger protein
MNNESSIITTEDELLECPKCGSVEFCITQEKKYSFVWVRCRQCDAIFDRVTPINYVRRSDHVSN